MLKEIIRLAGRSVLFVLPALFALSPSLACAEPSPLTLRFTSAYMDRHPAYLEAFVPWMQRIAEGGDKTLAIRYFNPNTLCPEAGMFDAVAKGAVDIAANAHGRTPGRFPLMGVMDLPMLMPDSETGSMVSQEIFDKYPELQDESNNVHMLWHYVSAPHVLHSKTPITSLEDLKGMKVIAWAPLAVDVLKALGANPIQAVPHESYLSVQRGMADAVLCPLSTLRSFKISEAVSHTTTVPLMVDSFWAAMSPKVWEKLTPAQRENLTSSLADMPRLTGKALEEGAAREVEILKTEGHTFHTLAPEELARWQEQLAPIYQSWLADMAARGHQNAPALLEDVRLSIEKHKK